MSTQSNKDDTKEVKMLEDQALSNLAAWGEDLDMTKEYQPTLKDGLKDAEAAPKSHGTETSSRIFDEAPSKPAKEIPLLTRSLSSLEINSTSKKGGTTDIQQDISKTKERIDYLKNHGARDGYSFLLGIHDTKLGDYLCLSDAFFDSMRDVENDIDQSLANFSIMSQRSLNLTAAAY